MQNDNNIIICQKIDTIEPILYYCTKGQKYTLNIYILNYLFCWSIVINIFIFIIVIPNSNGFEIAMPTRTLNAILIVKLADFDHPMLVTLKYGTLYK